MTSFIRIGIAAMAGAAAIAVQAKAADLPYKAPPPVCPTCEWSGFYVGGTIGASTDMSSSRDTWNWFTTFPAGTLVGVGGGGLATLAAPLTTNNTFDNAYRRAGTGVIGGVEVGYNWQFGHFLAGVEADWSGTSERSTTSYTATPVTAIFPPFPQFFFFPGTGQGWTSEQKIDWLTTWRARAGWVTDCTVWYVTGGAAWARIENNYALLSSPGSPGAAATGVGAQFGLPGGRVAASFATTKTGWVVGAGVESSVGKWFGWGNNWSLKLEYLWVDLGTVTNTIVAPLVSIPVNAGGPLVTGNTAFTSSNHVYDQIIRLGLNYRFSYGPTYAPVYTK
jgi:outer membrane immunogenic protein